MLLYSRPQLLATLARTTTLRQEEDSDNNDENNVLKASLQRAQANALRCVAGHVECDLSPIPGAGDTWNGPNNS